MNPLKCLNDYGQVIWLDFLSRRFIADGSLKRLIDEDGLAGVTSNPSIFEKAIVNSSDYDALLKAVDRHGDLDERALFERVAVEDLQKAADVLRPVYDATRRRDGYVSIEVSPYLAMRTEETVAEARRLWHAVGRENLMIKVPATTPGLPAIRQLTGEGINVNITLLFSQKVYEDVVEAYLNGLEDLIARGGNPVRIASVASSLSVASTLPLTSSSKHGWARPKRILSVLPLRASAARWRLPMPNLPISATNGSSLGRAGRCCARRAPRRSDCFGQAPEPKTLNTAMCSMSRS
jgi:transaldolase/fructose-6-phosphate aldolase-like protein